MATIGDLLVRLGWDKDDFDQGLGDIGRDIEDFKNQAVAGLSEIGGGILQAGIGGVVAGLAALGGGLAASVAMASDSEQVMAQLDATLKSTGASFEASANAIPQVSTEAAAAMEEIASKNAETIQRINESAGEQVARVQERISRINSDYASEQQQRQQDLADSIASIQEGLQERLGELTRRHQANVASMNDQMSALDDRLAQEQADRRERMLADVADLDQNYADSQADRRQRLEDTVADIHERNEGRRSTLEEQLQNARSTAEWMAISAKIAKIDAEERRAIEKAQARAAREEEKAKQLHDRQVAALQKRLDEEEKKAQQSHDRQVVALQKRMDAENAEYERQQAQMQAQATKREEQLQKQYDKEVALAKVAYGQEVSDAQKALDEIDRKRQKALDNAAKDYEKANAQLREKFTPIDLGLVSIQQQVPPTKLKILELADSLSKLTMFEDDTILRAESLMLTFTNVGEGVFPGAIESAMNMSQALGTDLQSSIMQVGKALNDPIEGASALRRVGVSLTEQQMQQIKAFMDMGDVASAQGIILAELAKEFGGVARAAGETNAGQWTIAKNSLGNVAETIGMQLLPTLTTLAMMFNEWLSNPAVQQWIASLASNIGQFAQMAITNIPQVIGWFQNLFTWLTENQGVVVGALVAIGAAIATFVYTTVIPAAIAAITAFAPALLVMAAIGLAAYLLYEAWTNNWGGIREKTAELWAWLQPILQQIWDWLSVNIPAAIQAFSQFWEETLVPALQAAWSWINGSLIPTLKLIWDWFATNIPAALAALRAAWDSDFMGIRSIFEGAWNMIQAAWGMFRAALEGDWRTFGAKLREFWDAAWTAVSNAFKSQIDSIFNIAVSLSTRIVDWFKGIDWGQVGLDIVQGIANGITNATEWAVKAIIELGSAVIEAIRGFLNMKSPSKKLDDEGYLAGTGFGMGISRSISDLVANIPVVMRPLAPAMAGSGRSMPAVSGQGGQGGGGINVQFIYQPGVSLGDRYEAERVIMPWVEAGVRKAVADGKIKGT